MSKPGFYFYTGDWLKDTKGLSLEARGAWIDLLCGLNESGGTVTWPLQMYEHYLSTVERNGVLYSAREILDELSNAGVCDISPEPNGKITVSCRRMLRTSRAAENNRERQARYRKKSESNAPVTSKNKPSSSSYSSSSSLNLKEATPPSAALALAAKKESEEIAAKIKAVTDKIYKHDPERYAKLIVWVNQAKNHFSVALVLSVLENFARVRAADTSIQNWRAYLSQVIEREEKKQNGVEAEKRHAAEKRSEAEWARDMFGGSGFR